MSEFLQAIAGLSPGKKVVVIALVTLVALTWLAVCLVVVGVIGP